MLVMVIDTETTGLDTSKDLVIEMAAALLDTKSRSLVAAYSNLISADENPAEHVNHIPVSALQLEIAKTPDLVPFASMALVADIIVAHNSAFDQPMVDRLFAAHGVDLIDKPWVCSYSQMLFPKDLGLNGYQRGGSMAELVKALRAGLGRGGSKKLAHLAVDHGLMVVDAHRAINDVFILSNLLLTLNEEEFEAEVLDALTPRLLYNARLARFEDKDLAKERGFRWNGEQKKWQKALVADEIPGLPFPVDPA